MIKRELQKTIIEKLHNYDKSILLYGARQVGKTTLVKNIINELGYKTLSINADENKYTDVLSSRDLLRIKSLVEGYELLFIDEAQRIPDIGINLKIIIDGIPNLKVIATGSSSFDLANKVSEPLTGRVWPYTLFPISFLELNSTENSFELNEELSQRLIYGSYPEIFSLINNTDKEEYLKNLSDNYLYKDIFDISDIKNTLQIRNLLKLLSFQIGSEVSLSEIGSQLEMSKNTVAKYIDLLEKSFVVFRLSAFNKNLRKEVSRMDKIYFYDLGIRNIVIDNLKDISNRNDIGQLWENFLILERMKTLKYNRVSYSKYFWRTYTGAKLDYIEEKGETLHGYEFKVNSNKAKLPKSWIETYKNSDFKLINKTNYIKFILNQK